MSRDSGLARHQFAASTWGFPPIPIPERREVPGGAIRLAPANVSNMYLDHPIYWTDPALTAWDREAESEDEWCVRMFYLLTALGCMEAEPVVAWRPMLPRYGVAPTAADLEAYRREGAGCRLDALPLLGMDDLVRPWAEMEEQHAKAAAAIARRRSGDWDAAIARQADAYSKALRFVGAMRINDPSYHPDDPDGSWSQLFEGRFAALSAEYDRRLAEEGGRLADLVGQATELFAEFRQVMCWMEEHIGVLAVAVLVPGKPSLREYARSVYHVQLCRELVSRDGGDYDFGPLVAAAMAEERAPGALGALADRCWLVHQSVWYRARLAAINLHRKQHGLLPHRSYLELEAALAAAAGAGAATSASMVDDVDKMLGGAA